MHERVATEQPSWVDLSVIDEMARRLRSVEAWDNRLGDGVALLKARIETLDRFSRFEGFNYREIRRPLKTWEDARRVLVVIAAQRFRTFTDIPAPVEYCLTCAVLFDRWEKEGRTPPEDVRGMMHGDICVEFAKGDFVLVSEAC